MSEGDVVTYEGQTATILWQDDEDDTYTLLFEDSGELRTVDKREFQ